MGLKAEMEKRILVYYKTHIVGDYSSDITVEDVIICELKPLKAYRRPMRISLSIIQNPPILK